MTMNNLYVITGAGQTGKSRLALDLISYARTQGESIQLIRTSTWLRGQTQIWEHSKGADNKMFSLLEPRFEQDPNVLAKWLKERMAAHPHVSIVIEGFIRHREVKEIGANWQGNKLLVFLNPPTASFANSFEQSNLYSLMFPQAGYSQMTYTQKVDAGEIAHIWRHANA